MLELIGTIQYKYAEKWGTDVDGPPPPNCPLRHMWSPQDKSKFWRLTLPIIYTENPAPDPFHPNYNS